MLKETEVHKVHRDLKAVRENLEDLDHLDCKGLGVWLDDQDYQERMVL